MPDSDEVRRESDRIMHARLDNIDGELRQVRQAIVTLARVEERMAAVAASDTRVEAQMTGIFTRLNILEASTMQNNKALGNVERAWWILFAAVCAVAVKFLLR